MDKSRNNNVSKFGQKLLKYRINFKDILKLLGLAYKDAYYNCTLFFQESVYQKSENSDDFII